MATGKNTPQWQQFCEEARRILGKKIVGGGGRSMHLKIDELAKLKQILDLYQDAIDSVVYQELSQEIDKLGSDAHKLALEHEKAQTQKDKEKAKMAVQLAGKLSKDIKATSDKVDNAIKNAGVSDAGREGARKLADWRQQTLDQFELLRAERGHRDFQALIKLNITGLNKAYQDYLQQIKDVDSTDAVKKLEKLWTAWSENQIESLKRSAVEIKDKEEQEVRDKSEYPSRLVAAEQLVQLLDRGGNSEDASTVKRAIAEAKKWSTATPPNWAEALRLLKEQLGQAKAYQKKLTELQESGESQFGSQCELIESKLKEYAGKVDARTHQDIVGRFALAKGQAGELEEAFPLNNFLTNLLDAIERADELTRRSTKLINDLSPEVAVEPDYLEPTAYRGIVEQLRLLRTALSEKRVGDMARYQPLLQDWLDTQMPALQKAAQTARDGFDSTKRALDERLKKVKVAKEDQAGTESLSVASSIVNRELDEALRRKDWALVQRLTDKATTLISLLESRASLRESNKDTLGPRKLQVDELLASTRTALDQLERDLRQSLAGKSAPPGADVDGMVNGSIGPLRSRLNGFDTTWVQQKPQVASVKEVEQLGIEQGLRTLAKDIAQTELAGLVDKVWDSLWRAAYAEKVLALKPKLARLALADPLSVVELRASLDRTVNDTSKDWDARMLFVDEVGGQIETRQSQLQKSLDTAKQQALLKIQEADRLASAAKARSGKFIAMIDDCKQQVDEVRNVEEYTNLAMAQDALALLEEVVGILQSFDNRTGERASVTLEKGWTEVQQLLKTHSADMLKNTPKRKEALETRMKKAEEGLFALKPSAFNASVQGFRDEIASILRDVESVKASRLQLTQLAAHGRERVQLLKIAESAPKYEQSLLQRIDQALKAADKSPDAIATSKVDLESLHRDLDALKTGEGGLDQQSKEAQANLLREQERKSRQRIQFEAELTDFHRVYDKRLAEALKAPMADTKQKKEIERTIAMAAKSFKAKDYDAALRYLAQARDRVDAIVLNPQGDYIGRRNALPEHAQHYANAVNGLREGLGKFREAAANALTGREGADALIARNNQALEAVSRLFEPLLFVESAKRLQDKTLDTKIVREERERTLQRVRQQREAMKADAVLTALLDNPLVPLRKLFEVVEKRLETIEANVRRCVQ